MSEIDDLRRENELLRRANEELRKRVSSEETSGEAPARDSTELRLAQDVADRIAAQEALRRSEARFRAVIEKSSEAISLTSADGKLLYLSPPASRLFGFAVDDLRGKTVLDHILPEDLPRAAALRTRLLRGQDSDVFEEIRVRHRDGSIRWLEASGTNLLDEPDVQAVVGNFRDITSRKHAEEALRESRSLLEEAQSIAHIGSWTSGVGRNDDLQWSRECYRIFGLPEGSPMSVSAFLERVHPDDREAVQRAFQRANEQETPYEIEHRVCWPDGSVRWVHERAVLDRGSHGRSARMLGTVQDITARHDASEALRRAEEQLRQAQKMEAVGLLAGGVAHDFNNLLCVILSYAELASADLPPGEALRDDLEEIRIAAQRATDLTRQLLAFSRRQVLQPRVVALDGIVAGMERMLARVLGEDLELVVRSEPQLGCVLADPGQIEQVIMNLAVNTRDAMVEGGRLTIETANVRFGDETNGRPESVPPGDYVMLAMTDSGIGMDEATLSRIFEPFFTTKEQGRGSGLGLATVFGIVRQSGGHIDVQSSPGHGSRFAVYLPRTERTADAVVPPTKLPVRGGAETILLVEDEDQVRAVAAAILRRHGYHVLDVSSGAHALLASQDYAGEIHLLLTDVVMPRMSGPKLVEQLSPLRPEARVLYASGYTVDAMLQDRLLHAGAAFLQKPFTPEALLRKVREVLGEVETSEGG